MNDPSGAASNAQVKLEALNEAIAGASSKAASSKAASSKSGTASNAQVKLETLVHQTIEEHGQPFEGKIWAIRSRQEWADMAGVSIKTVTRIFKKPPFATLQKVWNGKQAVLVRIGKPDPNQPSRLAATMAKMFRDNIVLNDEVNAKQKAIREAEGKEWKPKKSVTPREYGCLIGLSMDFRQGWQLEIFKYAISPEGWEATKDLSKLKTHDLETPVWKILEETNDEYHYKLKPGKFHHFHTYPHIPTLRVFWMCAESAFVGSKFDGEMPKDEHAFWLDWWEERNGFALLDWEPKWKNPDK